MGGYSSGRYRTRNRGAVEEAMRIDMRWLRRRGFVRPGATVSGPLSWSSGSSVHATVNLSEREHGCLVVRFTRDGQHHVQQIDITSSPMRFGGRRFYFVCPRRGGRCEVLAMVGGVFASRQAHRLAYASQSEGQLDRLRETAEKLAKRLWPADPRRAPRGRNRERLMARWREADEAFEALFAEQVLRRFGRLL